MNKLAIVFPGVNYRTESPLFYYSNRLLRKHNFEVIDKKGHRETLVEKHLHFSVSSY